VKHYAEIDQSGKFADTRVCTVLAIANHVRYSVLVKATTKRSLVIFLRKHRISPQRFYIALFTVCIFFLIRENLSELQGESITVDIEYTGHNRGITDTLLRLCKANNIKLSNERILFDYIGKKSSAHKLAIKTFRGEEKAGRTLKEDEFIEQLKEIGYLKGKG